MQLAFLYNTKFAIMDGFLLLKFWADGELVYMMPIGNGDLNKVLDALIEDANREGEPFCLLGICAGMCSELETFMPGRFQFTADRDYADYVYLPLPDLATLSGKKFQAKRNHINKFKKTYNYEYTPITADRIRECLDLEAEWRKVNNCDQHEGTGNERRALIYALHNRWVRAYGRYSPRRGQDCGFYFRHAYQPRHVRSTCRKGRYPHRRRLCHD